MKTNSRVTARGFTIAEVLTALVVVVIVTAVAVPMWRNHQLRIRRADAIAALLALQVEQDRFFGQNARYADAAALTRKPPEGLGLTTSSAHGFYAIELRTADDGLAYTATARAITRDDGEADTRCTQFGIDHHGIRRAIDATGKELTADCWR